MMCEACGCRSGIDTIVLRVEGMTCGHCKNAVEKAVRAIPGVSSAEVTLDDNTVTVNFDTHVVGVDAIKNAIADAGYQVA
ncbi:MAG: copper ion binding protein [Bacillota bacterium]